MAILLMPGAHATIERIEAINGRQLIWFSSDNT